MNRYYSDSDDAYFASRQPSDSIRASGWQTPLPSLDEPPSSSSVTRIVVECPFGSKKCDYKIDKSQRGRLIVTARRRRIFSSDYLSLNNNKNNTAIQTFTIPYDADVDRLQSHVERYTNRLIIEIPRTYSSYIDKKNTYIRSPDLFKSSTGASRLIGHDQKYSRKDFDDNRKLEYRVDCQGYTADELDVSIQGRDLIVEGRSKRSTSADPTQQHLSKQLSQKISLPHTVDLSKVISYFENGELRIEAPLKRGIYHSDEEILSPERTSTAMVSRRVGGYNRVQSPISGNHRRHYRRRERVSRHHQQPSSAVQRVRSVESLYHPSYRSPRDFDDDDDDDDDDNHRYRRRVNYEHHSTNRHDSEQQPLYRSIYEPGHNGVTTRTTTYRTYPVDNEVYYRY
jgi:HSP20 family molecular chaperone IbpA